MNDRQKKILDAAIAVFSRYGLRKATMGDIAEQAGISRQTLYARYSNKEEIISAAMELIAEQVCREVKEGWGPARSIGERLDIFLDAAVVQFFDQVRQMPDASDLLIGNSDGAKGAHMAAEQGKIDLLTCLFEPFGEALAAKGSSPEALAEFFYASAASYKFIARDADHLHSLLATLKQNTLIMLGEG
ncbi:Transcriptional regulator [Hoeflea phototrophica DFL-43]|uniref:Transcriptional regulator n=1 Tax=Hoeflea phototrophica (strain DSM 17068 / NCIMB 14078 / DFL-43) TaxID=411684 RepID=A9DDV9_HOEPD|nr:Transcriptional regulator [Hoeflea phototrophica DFL-43]